jgi:hypothetical protein
MQPHRHTVRTLVVLLGLLYSLAGCNITVFAQTEERFQASIQAVLPEQPYEVAIGVWVDQITHIDQKSENFGVVANLRLEWHDPQLAFDTKQGGHDARVYSRDAFVRFLDENGLFGPGFVIHNQQGRRFVQEAEVVVFNNGHAIYYERFSATLQAPDFDFVQYPFDNQKFYVHVDALYPTGFLNFVPLDGFSGLGDRLGEEEWIFNDSWNETSEVKGITGKPTSRFSFGFVAHRHLNYYVLRIFVPLIIIVLVSWLTFFLQDFSKRVDIASANLLIFVAFNFTISNDLPRLGYLTFMDAILVAFFAFTSMVVVANVLFRRMEITGRESLARRIDNYTIWIYPFTLGVLVLLCWYWLVRESVHF